MDELTILNGGVELDVATREGGKERVKVRQLPIRLLPHYADLQADEAALVELFCDKPQGWADTLTVPAHEEVLALGEQLNADPFDRWLQRRSDGINRLAGKTQVVLGSARSALGSGSGPGSPS